MVSSTFPHNYCISEALHLTLPWTTLLILKTNLLSNWPLLTFDILESCCPRISHNVLPSTLPHSFPLFALWVLNMGFEFFMDERCKQNIFPCIFYPHQTIQIHIPIYYFKSLQSLLAMLSGPSNRNIWRILVYTNRKTWGHGYLNISFCFPFNQSLRLVHKANGGFPLNKNPLLPFAMHFHDPQHFLHLT